MDKSDVLKAFHDAVDQAIKSMGMGRFKETSFFGSNDVKGEEK